MEAKQIAFLFDRHDLDIGLTEVEPEGNIVHEYDIPTECRRCDSKDISLRAIYVPTSKTLMLMCLCNECGDSSPIMTRKNGANKHNPSDGALRTWVGKVKQRCEYKCAICGSAHKIHAHHIIPIGNDWGNEYKYMPSNGIALCEECHAKVHSRRKAE